MKEKKHVHVNPSQKITFEAYFKIPFNKIDELSKKIEQACKECGAEVTTPPSFILLRRNMFMCDSQ